MALLLQTRNELYLAAPGLRAERDRNSANTRATTIPGFTPISVRARVLPSEVQILHPPPDLSQATSEIFIANHS